MGEGSKGIRRHELCTMVEQFFRLAMVSGVDGSSDNHDVSHMNQILCICTKAKSGDN